MTPVERSGGKERAERREPEPVVLLYYKLIILKYSY